jgi:hypothetical protein
VIQDASITNAKIADASITYAKIAAAQIGVAHIIDGNITTAKIGIAQIDTLRVAGNAITVPVSASAAGNVAQTGWVYYNDAITLNINAYINATGRASQNEWKSVLMNIVAYGADGSVRNLAINVATGMMIFQTIGCTYSFTTWLPAGSYYFVLTGHSGGSVIWNLANLSVIGAMR